MKLDAICKDLRETSAKFGGIKHYLAAADELDRAIAAHFKEQDTETLARLNGAYASADRFWMQSKRGGSKEGPEVLG